MSKYCPYYDEQVVYLVCRECDEKICQPDTFFCMAAGPGEFDDYNLLSSSLNHILERQHKVVMVADGETGVSSMVERYAHEHGYPVIRDVQTYGFLSRQKRSGCVVFWNGKDDKTKQSIKLAKEYGIPIRIIHM